MLIEISRFRNYGGCAERRSFTNSDMDLYVWFKDQVPERFHLTYNKQGRARSISWNNAAGFDQQRLAQIEAVAVLLGVSGFLDPFLLQDSADIRTSELAYQFLHCSEKIAPWLADFIYARLLEYPAQNSIWINQSAALRSF